MADYQSNLIKLSEGQFWLAHWFKGTLGFITGQKSKAICFISAIKGLQWLLFFLLQCLEVKVRYWENCSVADPGFPRGGGTNPPGGANIWFCQIFQKTALNWKNLSRGEGACPKFYYVDPPLLFSKMILIFPFYFSKEGHLQRKSTKTFKLLVISQLMRV